MRTEWVYLCAGLGDRTKIVDHVGLGHTNAGITDREGLRLLVRDEADVKILAAIKDRRVRERLIADLVKRI